MKSSKATFRLTPSLMRIILVIMLVVIAAISAAGFAYVEGKLMTYAKDISRLKVDATASNATISSLEKVKTDLDNYRDAYTKMQSLRANDRLPEFRVIDEIKRIAARNNIPIASFDYKKDGDSGTTSGTSGTPNTSTPTPPTPSSAGNTIALIVNFKPVKSYRDYLQFLYDIEQNIPKLKVDSVGVTKGGTSSDNQQQGQQAQSSDGFSIEPLTVELYTR